MLALLAVVFAAIVAPPTESAGFILAGEVVRFDAALRPQFSEEQRAASADSTRAGFAKWAATAEGQAIIARFRGGDREVVIVESADERGIGRAPQPGLATLLTAGDSSKLKPRLHSAINID